MFIFLPRGVFDCWSRQVRLTRYVYRDFFVIGLWVSQVRLTLLRGLFCNHFSVFVYSLGIVLYVRHTICSLHTNHFKFLRCFGLIVVPDILSNFVMCWFSTRLEKSCFRDDFGRQGSREYSFLFTSVLSTRLLDKLITLSSRRVLLLLCTGWRLPNVPSRFLQVCRRQESFFACHCKARGKWLFLLRGRINIAIQQTLDRLCVSTCLPIVSRLHSHCFYKSHLGAF